MRSRGRRDDFLLNIYWCENLTKAVIDPAFRTFYVVRNGLLVEISAAEYAELAALKGLQV